MAKAQLGDLCLLRVSVMLCREGERWYDVPIRNGDRLKDSKGKGMGDRKPLRKLACIH
jgi:hypothetical protein